MRRSLDGLLIAGLFLAGWLGFRITGDFATHARAGSPSAPESAITKGNPGRGREVFNGKGACYHCHGIDGYLGRRPRQEAETAALIARLNPPPTDLRDRGSQRLKTDQERSRMLRDGHAGSGIFPDVRMTDQDLVDTLIYLALIRKDPHPTQD